jgi:opacity protein-like surface antigen
MKKMYTKAAMALMITTAGLHASHVIADETTGIRDNRGWFVGGALSSANGEAEVGNVTMLDEKGIGFGVYGGYNFSDWFGLEGASFQSDNMSNDRPGLDSAEFFTLSFMPKLTVNFNDSVGIFFKAGPTFVMYTEEYNNYEGDYWDDEFDWSEVILGAGVGTEIAIQDGVKLRLSYDYVSGNLDENWYDWDAPNERVDVTLGRFALGVHYQF